MNILGKIDAIFSEGETRGGFEACELLRLIMSISDESLARNGAPISLKGGTEVVG